MFRRGCSLFCWICIYWRLYTYFYQLEIATGASVAPSVYHNDFTTIRVSVELDLQLDFPKINCLNLTCAETLKQL